MKKLYSLLAAAFVGVAANAQLYVCGTGQVGDTYLGWEPATPYTVAAAADGTYTFTVKGSSQIKMSTALGTWDEFNAEAVGVSDLKVGDNTLETYGENTVFPWEGDWTLKVDLTKMTLNATTTTPKPEGYTKLYVVGSVASMPEAWGDGFIASHELTTTDGVLYTFDSITLAPGDQFKIAGNGWSPNYGAGAESAVYPGKEMTLAGGANPGNLSVMIPYTGKMSFNVSTLAFILGELAGIESVEMDNNVAPVYYNLQGVRVENAENGLFIEVRGNKAVKVIK